MNCLLSYKGYLISFSSFCLLVSIVYHQNLKKCSHRENRIILINSTKKASELSELTTQINEIFNQIDERMPNVTFIHKDTTTSAKNSKVFIKTPQNRYCVGDQLTVQVDVYDYLGQRKSYGGDYLRSRISNPDKAAGSSGRIEDFNNGTYHIHFTLFWEGKVVVTVFLMHPSEAVTALWRARNSWYGNVDYLGKFTSEGKEMITKCGYDLDKKDELCEYADHENEEYFYCVKPQNFSCDSYTEFKNWKTLATQLSDLENSLLTQSNVRVEIPVNMQPLEVILCNKSSSKTEATCKTGISLEYPSGYVMNNLWYPKTCNMQTYHTVEELNTCMQGKFFYMFGDSTMHQWMTYFENKLKKMPPKLKAKSSKKKKAKKSKAGTGSLEEQFRKATLEVDVLQDHLALQRQVTRQAQQRKYELHGKLQELHEDIQDERDEKQAIYNEMTRRHWDLEQQSSARIQNLEEEVAELKLQLNDSHEAYQLLSEESLRTAIEKETEIEELKKQVENMETEYEQILHSSLDRILAKLTVTGQQWEKESITIHQQYKHMLQDCGLNPLDI